MYRMTEFERGETTGAIRALKWVLFIMSYKRESAVQEEILSFIKTEEARGEEFTNLEEY